MIDVRNVAARPRRLVGDCLPDAPHRSLHLTSQHAKTPHTHTSNSTYGDERRHLELRGAQRPSIRRGLRARNGSCWEGGVELVELVVMRMVMMRGGKGEEKEKEQE
jgi:hypothetical protein